MMFFFNQKEHKGFLEEYKVLLIPLCFFLLLSSSPLLLILPDLPGRAACQFQLSSAGRYPAGFIYRFLHLIRSGLKTMRMKNRVFPGASAFRLKPILM